MSIKKIKFKKVCRRCDEIFDTAGKYSRICPKCVYVGGRHKGKR